MPDTAMQINKALFLSLSIVMLPAVLAAASQPHSSCASLLVNRGESPRELETFLSLLRTAVKARDAGQAGKFFSPDARFDFGDQLTFKDLDLADPAAPAWADLAKALAPGCAPVTLSSEETSWECPGLKIGTSSAETSSSWMRLAILGIEGPVAMRARPAATAPIIAELTCAAALLRGGVGGVISGVWAPQDWVLVRLESGLEGYVRGQNLYSPVGYRLFLERRAEGWRITAFLAGD